jgi:hypothetical protein
MRIAAKHFIQARCAPLLFSAKKKTSSSSQKGFLQCFQVGFLVENCREGHDKRQQRLDQVLKLGQWDY